jgi:hypothetical protein
MIPIERRKHPRHETIPNVAVLDWGTMTTCDGGNVARMMDISRGGARLATDEPLPQGQPLWLRLEVPITTPWVAARLVRREEHGRVGVRFEGDAPEELMLAATLGIALDFRVAPGLR